MLHQIICQSLAGFGNRIDIHTVCSCPKDSPKSSGTKGQVFIKGIPDFFFLICHLYQFFFQIIIQYSPLHPQLILFYYLLFDFPMLHYPLFHYPLFHYLMLHCPLFHYPLLHAVSYILYQPLTSRNCALPCIFISMESAGIKIQSPLKKLRDL